MKSKSLKVAALLLGLGISAQASAIVVSWADWTGTTASGANGQITTADGTVGVTYSGAYSFVQTGSGTNYWTEGTPAPYTSGVVENAPPAAELVALNVGGSKTITFSETVLDPYLALTSWNGNVVDFGDDVLDFISSGRGFWGLGSFIPNADNTGFFGSGELHGIIRLTGEFDSIIFTDTTENWHGFTVGVAGLADDGGSVPEPTTLALLGLGLAGLGYRRRGARKA